MCYVFPIAGAAVTHCVWSRTKSVKVLWLMLLFYGGALFGTIDHLWNGELFLISENIANDIFLGLTITGAIFAVWGIMLRAVKSGFTSAGYAGITK